jgi:hypothetical protein
VLTAFFPRSVLDEYHPVYAIKTIHAIPLSEERATVAVNALLSRNTRNPRPSLLPPVDNDLGPQDPRVQPEPPTRAVKFADWDEIKVITPVATREDFAGPQDNAISSPSSSSGRSSPSSEISQTGPVERTIADRLAFWNRPSKKSQPTHFGDSDSYPVDDPDPSLDTLIKEAQEPAKVLGDIITTTAPAPTTQEERHNQLEDKIVREIIREFSKGGMYFAYSFGQRSIFAVHQYTNSFAKSRYHPVFTTQAGSGLQGE